MKYKSVHDQIVKSGHTIYSICTRSVLNQIVKSGSVYTVGDTVYTV